MNVLKGVGKTVIATGKRHDCRRLGSGQCPDEPLPVYPDESWCLKNSSLFCCGSTMPRTDHSPGPSVAFMDPRALMIICGTPTSAAMDPRQYEEFKPKCPHQPVGMLGYCLRSRVMLDVRGLKHVLGRRTHEAVAQQCLGNGMTVEHSVGLGA